MTNEQILKKAIEKAVENGYERIKHGIDVLEYGKLEPRARIVRSNPQLNTLIFSHDFAKAFWLHESWVLRLQQMVVEKNPIKYLEQYLD